MGSILAVVRDPSLKDVKTWFTQVIFFDSSDVSYAEG